jgi:hypothetical protein
MTFASEVSILDIGLGGVSVRADKRLNIGGRYRLKIECQPKALDLTCEVAWARMSGTKRSPDGESVAVYTAGMKFVGLSPQALADLHGVIAAVGQAELPATNDRRTHPRVPADPPGIALLGFPADYTVRTLSLSGMLIECPEAVVPESRIPMALSLDGGPDVEFRGRVVSCIPGPEGDARFYRIGIEFVDLTDAGRSALASYIGRLPAESA